ncbi:MAG: haloacid dehalogenase type II [Betaproteobacteria bacterium]|nr:MAG: haloacid dehalogenase type II [Betaproteobacteria bacterium]
MTAFDPRSIKALVCDVFGTVVDWRASIIREGELLASAKGLNVDWAAFADAWRAGYPKAMDRVRRGELPWTRIDDLHRVILDELLLRFDLGSLNADEVDQLNRVWHRLTPWPDSVAGLQRLRSRFVVATLSNGNVSLLVNMAKHAGLPWDCILSAEIFHRYKPDLEVYRQAADMLGFAPEQVLMVAAHPSDLRAAREAGLKTAYVVRPLEYGAGRRGEDVGDDRFDVVANDFVDLAEQLMG